ncbi:NAD(P)-binding domain protein [Metarhizium robertsii ARSEF 23]|uniref:NAD(P)-binding domain protein n=1 Tax=Metarhizium robertsii (strain ARSEF 23 / ATCC MYA-3075) TaxID=655844 RepID=E9F9T6_METRA|nr:NAD(P)-binding domain protein [Metarhizium robertsii ARSEF 23]EFY95579.1 NAD(P)-binding domain protein [Metarhizium robertsii ARSEF 23]
MSTDHAVWFIAAGFSIYAMTKACASSLAESLRDELAPFQIRATTVEPGYFRTSFLNAGVMVNAGKRIEVYNDEATPTGQTRRKLLVVDNNIEPARRRRQRMQGSCRCADWNWASPRQGPPGEGGAGAGL